MMKKARHLLEYLLLRALHALISVLPRPAVYSLAQGLGLLAFHVLRVRRRVAMTNMVMALGPKYMPAQLERICRDSYVHIATTFVEILLSSRLKHELRTLADITELALLKRYSDAGQGVVALACHIGNWEIAAAALAAAGCPCTVIAAHQSNPYVDRFMTDARDFPGVTVVKTTDSSVKHLVRALKNGQVTGLVSDQDAGDQGVFVEFFGRPASFAPGGAQLALKYHTPVYVAALIRTRPGKYTSICREIPVEEDDTVSSLTQRYAAAMEEIIRAHPEQYLWMHRRWKSQPPAAPPVPF